MKHTRVTAASFAAVLNPLAGIVASLAGVLPARGVEVPFTRRGISGSEDGAVSVFATDVDGDGDTDVLSASHWDDTIAWFESDGSSPPSFTYRAISTAADGAESVFATDVDGDGHTDVLSASAWDDTIAWYESNGGSPPTFTERVISTAADGACSVFATDVDGDGDIDVLSASRYDNKIAWYESNGGSRPTFTERVISTAANDTTTVFATDVDGDGDTDVLSASYDDDKIAWYENDGEPDPTFTEWVISTAADGARSVFATDVDGDGDTDVLSASYYDDNITWYENTTPTCGNAVVGPGEMCDDGNTDDGDGCSSTCTVESGYTCIAEPSICFPDCNDNDIPDECDLTCVGPCTGEGCGQSYDADENGIPELSVEHAVAGLEESAVSSSSKTCVQTAVASTLAIGQCAKAPVAPSRPSLTGASPR